MAFSGSQMSTKLMYIAWYTTTVCLWVVLLYLCVSPYVAHTASLPFCANVVQGLC